MEETCNPIPSCLLILSFVPLNARMILGTKWKASPPHKVRVKIPYSVNKILPLAFVRKITPATKSYRYQR